MSFVSAITFIIRADQVRPRHLSMPFDRAEFTELHDPDVTIVIQVMVGSYPVPDTEVTLLLLPTFSLVSPHIVSSRKAESGLSTKTGKVVRSLLLNRSSAGE